MQNQIAFIFISIFYSAFGLSAQDAVKTAFIFSGEERSALQQLMIISESHPHVKELFFLEEQPKKGKESISIATATGPNSFALGNLTPSQMYARILQVPAQEIHASEKLNNKRYNLFYHSGEQALDEELRQKIARRFLERIDIKVSTEDSVVMDRLVFHAEQDIHQSFAQVHESGTAWIQNSSFQISLRNHSLSKILAEIQKHPLFTRYQLVDQTGLSEEQTLDVDLSTESIDDFIASAAEHGLEITMEEGKGRKVMLTPQ